MAYLGDTSTPKLWKRMKAYINNRIANLEQGITMDLLWENASPTSSFAAQTINLDLSDCNAVMIEHKQATTLDPCRNHYIRMGGHDLLNHLTSPYGINAIHNARGVNVNNSGVAFGGGVTKIVSNTNAGTADNKVIIPLRIYGIKEVK